MATKAEKDKYEIISVIIKDETIAKLVEKDTSMKNIQSGFMSLAEYHQFCEESFIAQFSDEIYPITSQKEKN